MDIAQLNAANETLLTKVGSVKVNLERHRESMQNVSDFMYKQVKRHIYPQDDHGAGEAKADLKRELDCSMAANTDIVIAQNPVFETDIEGKVMKVGMCGPGGNDLVGNVIDRISATHVQLDVFAAATAHASTNNRMVMWGTDDTLPYRAAAQKIADTKRGIFCVSGMSVIAGGLVGTIGGINYNCQIAFPHQSYTDPRRGQYQVEGQTYMGSADNGPGNVGYTRPSLEADGVASFLTTSSPGASVFGTGGSVGIPFNYANISLKNIKVLVPTNSMGDGAGIGGVNLKWAANQQIWQCIAGVDDNLRFSVLPVHGHVGFESNNEGSDCSNYWEMLNAYGFEYAFMIATEHMTSAVLQGYGSSTAFGIKNGGFSCNGTTWIMHWGKEAMRVKGGGNILVHGMEVEGIQVGNHPITNAPTWCMPDANGYYIDETVGKGIRGMVVGESMTGGTVVGYDPVNVGLNIALPTYAQLAAKIRS